MLSWLFCLATAGVPDTTLDELGIWVETLATGVGGCAEAGGTCRVPVFVYNVHRIRCRVEHVDLPG